MAASVPLPRIGRGRRCGGRFALRTCLGIELTAR